MKCLLAEEMTVNITVAVDGALLRCQIAVTGSSHFNQHGRASSGVIQQLQRPTLRSLTTASDNS